MVAFETMTAVKWTRERNASFKVREVFHYIAYGSKDYALSRLAEKSPRKCRGHISLTASDIVCGYAAGAV
jgi:hypothetical protein